MKTQTIDTGKAWLAVLTGPTTAAVTITSAINDTWLAVDSATPAVTCGHLLSRGQSVLVSLDAGEILYARSGSNFDTGVLAFTV